MDIIPGDVLMVKSKGYIGSGIERITSSPYGHAAIFSTPVQLIEADGFRKVGYQDPSIYRGNADVIRMRGISMGERLQVVKNAENQIGYVYDWPLIVVELIRFTIGITLPWHEFHCRICSTLIADSFSDAGFDPTPGIAKPAPGDLPKSLLFEWMGAYT